jgi:predicted lipid-binding transport protein (Tim44 family)
MRMLAQRNAAAPATAPMQYSGAGMGSETVAAPPPSQASGFEHGSVAPAPAPRVPAGFDAAGFARGAKMNYLKLQMANDSGNLEEIREFTTPEMFEELSRDVAARGGARQHTEILSLEADVLEVVTEGAMHWASVRFTGAERGAAGQPAESFEEVWNLSKPVDGSTGWVLAGIQQMH